MFCKNFICPPDIFSNRKYYHHSSWWALTQPSPAECRTSEPAQRVLGIALPSPFRRPTAVAEDLLLQMLRGMLSLSHSAQSSWAAAPGCNVQPVHHVLSATAHQQKNQPEPDRHLSHIRRYCSTLPGQTPLTSSFWTHHIWKNIYVQANFLDANSLTATRAVCRCQLTGDGLYVVLLA